MTDEFFEKLKQPAPPIDTKMPDNFNALLKNQIKNNKIMKRFEDLTIKQVKKEILTWEYDQENPQKIDVITIGQDPDVDCYEQGDGHLCEHFYAEIMIDDEPISRGYEWDTEDATITASFDPSQEED